MATKFGVSTTELEKLRKFQISLMKRKFEATESMDFINLVQFSSEYAVVPTMTRVSVANNRMYFCDGMLVIPCGKISNRIIHQNGVILQFRVPLLSIGSRINLKFANTYIRDNFLETIDDSDHSDETSSVYPLTPPNSFTKEGIAEKPKT